MMSDSMKAKLRTLITGHEDKKNFPYLDSLGNITIGIGYNLTARGLPDSWIMEQFDMDVSYFYNQLNTDFSWFKTLSEPRQMVLIDMCFMGYKKFLEFKKMLAAIEEGDIKGAAMEMLSSEWASQVKGRAAQDAQIWLSGSL